MRVVQRRPHQQLRSPPSEEVRTTWSRWSDPLLRQAQVILRSGLGGVGSSSADSHQADKGCTALPYGISVGERAGDNEVSSPDRRHVLQGRRRREHRGSCPGRRHSTGGVRSHRPGWSTAGCHWTVPRVPQVGAKARTTPTSMCKMPQGSCVGAEHVEPYVRRRLLAREVPRARGSLRESGSTPGASWRRTGSWRRG
jgi:hypothetical protein